MLSRRSLLAGLAAGAIVLSGANAQAMNKRPFDRKAFDAAQAAGRPVLIDVYAPWCPVCKRQQAVLAKLASQPRFKKLDVFVIDFDSQKDLLRTFGVQRQSTLIAFKGRKEVGRSTGESDPKSIEALLAKAL